VETPPLTPSSAQTQSKPPGEKGGEGGIKGGSGAIGGVGGACGSGAIAFVIHDLKLEMRT